MAYVQVNVPVVYPYRRVYFVKEVVDHKLEKIGDVLVLQWYTDVERKGETVTKIPLPEVGAKYKVSWMGDYDHLPNKDTRVSLKTAGGVNILVSQYAAVACGNQYDMYWHLYSFDTTDTHFTTIMRCCSFPSVVSISRSILIVEMV